MSGRDCVSKKQGTQEGHTPFINPSHLGRRQIYRVNFRPAKAIQSETLSQNKTEQISKNKVENSQES